MPMANAPPVGPDANGASIPSGPSMPGGDQLGQTLDASKGPTSVPVTSDTGTGSFLNNLAIGAGVTPDNSNTGTHGPLTRFGMLTRVLAPMIEGGLVGWAGGKGTPGGGFNAANNHFQNQRQLQMQLQVMRLNAQKQYYENAKNAAETNYYNQGGGARFNQPVVGDNGNYWQINRSTGKLEDTGVAAQDKTKAPPPDKTTVTTNAKGDQLVVNETKSTARPIVMEGSGEDGGGPVATGLPTKPTSSIAATKYDSGSPTTGSFGPSASPTRGNIGGAGAAPSAGLPLGPKFRPLPSGWRNQAEEDAAQEYRSKHPDASAADVLRYVSTLTREPKDNGMSPKEYRARQASLITQLNTGFREIENQRQRNIKSLGGTEMADPNDLSQIDSDAADEKQALHERLISSANAEGIDIGKIAPGFYQSQLKGGTPAQTLPTAPPKVQAQNSGGQTLDDATARQLFAEAGNDPVKARQLAAQRGYAVGNDQSSPVRPKGVPSSAVWNPQTKTWQLKKSSASGGR
jgi:hypothetical protein